MRLGLLIGYSGAKVELPVELVQEADRLGYYAVWTSEAYGSDAVTPLAWLGAQTQQIRLGTGIMQMPGRTPAMTAMTAMTLDQLSGGRCLLGLGLSGPQVVEGWHGVSYGKPLARTRDYVGIVRKAMRREAPVVHQGEYYQVPYQGDDATGLGKPLKSILQAAPHIPIYLAAVNEGMCALAGELCAGLHVHPFHTARYLRERILPAVERGAAAGGRTRADIALACTVFVVTGNNPDEIAARTTAAKQQIAFYASTPGYRAVMALHGWDDIAERLSGMARAGQWQEMDALISDDMLREIAVVAPVDMLADAVKERYDGLLDRVGYYLPFNPDASAERGIWQGAAWVFGA